VAADYDKYNSYKLIFHDKESEGLTFDHITGVFVDGEEITEGFELITDCEDECTFEVKFENLKLIEAVKAGSVITVEYESILNEDAVIGVPRNPNEMCMEYSNNPTDESSTGTTPWDKVVVFTYEVIVNKVDENGEPLTGAAFELWKWIPDSEDNTEPEPWSECENGVGEHGHWVLIPGEVSGDTSTTGDGKVVKINAIHGHSIPLGALGVFILWLGWYGFNGAAATSPSELSSIFLTTTIAPAVATCTTMIYTWKKNGKPDVSMCLNASLAGLVAITAGCDAMDALGAIIVGIVSGILVVVVVETLDLKLHVDDPVGAVGVHMANGMWGTLAVGLLANPDAPAGLKGLFYTGSFTQLGIQTLGLVTVAVYTTVLLFITFRLIEKTNGLRADPADELIGLDVSEHGLPSAYADFAPAVSKYTEYGMTGADSVVTGTVPPAEAIPVRRETALRPDGHKFTKVEIVFKEEKLYALKDAMSRLGITGMTVSHVMGYGIQKGQVEYYRGVAVETDLRPKVQVDIVVSAIPVRDVIETAKKVLYTGHIGDGKIFIYDVENVVKVRTGEEGYDALQDVE
jgi:fimbrial isopeptide formation D2 family protein